MNLYDPDYQTTSYPFVELETVGSINDVRLEPVLSDEDWPDIRIYCPYWMVLVNNTTQNVSQISVSCGRWHCEECAHAKSRTLLRILFDCFCSETTIWHTDITYQRRQSSDRIRTLRRRRGNPPTVWLRHQNSIHVFSSLDLSSRYTRSLELTPVEALTTIMNRIMRIPGFGLHGQGHTVRFSGEWLNIKNNLDPPKTRINLYSNPLGVVNKEMAEYVKEYCDKLLRTRNPNDTIDGIALVTEAYEAYQKDLRMSRK